MNGTSRGSVQSRTFCARMGHLTRDCASKSSRALTFRSSVWASLWTSPSKSSTPTLLKACESIRAMHRLSTSFRRRAPRSHVCLNNRKASRQRRTTVRVACCQSEVERRSGGACLPEAKRRTRPASATAIWISNKSKWLPLPRTPIILQCIARAGAPNRRHSRSAH